MKSVSVLYRRALPMAFRSHRRYLLFAGVLFSACIVIGYRGYSGSGDSLPWVFASLVRLKDSMATASPGRRILILFWNNFRVTLISVGLGWLLGLVPLVSLALNGVIIGVGVRSMMLRSGASLPAVAASFAAHGLFELPAFVAGQAVGIRIGFLTPLAWRGKGGAPDLGRAVAEGVTILVLFVVPLLALAAVLELEVSPAVLRMAAPVLK
ncbi:MAG: stage II sporulation protein M [Clostridia bacterium]|nr:stage II sporulation protein M [Clostridia bacterium]